MSWSKRKEEGLHVRISVQCTLNVSCLILGRLLTREFFNFFSRLRARDIEAPNVCVLLFAAPVFRLSVVGCTSCSQR